MGHSMVLDQCVKVLLDTLLLLLIDNLCAVAEPLPVAYVKKYNFWQIALLLMAPWLPTLVAVPIFFIFASKSPNSELEADSNTTIERLESGNNLLKPELNAPMKAENNSDLSKERKAEGDSVKDK
jgi:hypothetical protein